MQIESLERAQRAAAAADDEGSGTADGSGARKKPPAWFSTLKFAAGHGFKEGTQPTVQFAPPAGDGADPSWGPPVAVYRVPSSNSLELQGKLQGKGKARAETGHLVRCGRRRRRRQWPPARTRGPPCSDSARALLARAPRPALPQAAAACARALAASCAAWATPLHQAELLLTPLAAGSARASSATW